MENKVMLTAFNGELMCFVHVLLNAKDMHEKGYDVKIIFEGAACKLIAELDNEENPFNKLYRYAVENSLIEGICRACAHKMGTLPEAERQGLKLLDDMKGHPSLSGYIKRGYKIITF